MGAANPRQRSVITIRISKVGAGIAVTAVAHYKTTATTKTATSSATGVAFVAYNIGGATKGHRVAVSVTAAKAPTTWSCSTLFLPR